MRAILKTTFIAGAALCGSLAVATAAQAQQQLGPAAPVAKQADCPGNPNPLGVARVVEIDTTGGPGFGFQHYKMYDFLNPKEVVLTFDDGPEPGTAGVLDVLKEFGAPATFLEPPALNLSGIALQSRSRVIWVDTMTPQCSNPNLWRKDTIWSWNRPMVIAHIPKLILKAL